MNVWIKLRTIRERVRTADDLALLEHAPIDLYDLMRAIEAVLTLHDGHQRHDDPDGRFYCGGCPATTTGPVAWPCETRHALEQALVGGEIHV
jgi:hypothetical protein